MKGTQNLDHKKETHYTGFDSVIDMKERGQKSQIHYVTFTVVRPYYVTY